MFVTFKYFMAYDSDKGWIGEIKQSTIVILGLYKCFGFS